MPTFSRKSVQQQPSLSARRKHNARGHKTSASSSSKLTYWMLGFFVVLSVVYFGTAMVWMRAQQQSATTSRPKQNPNVRSSSSMHREDKPRVPVNKKKKESPDSDVHEYRRPRDRSSPEEEEESINKKPSSSKANDKSNTSQNEGDKKNPLRKFHLENKFGHGVDPNVLIDQDEDEFPIAYKSDVLDQPHPDPEHILTAYTEKLNLDEWEIKPLPARRLAKSDKLQKIEYNRMNSCSKFTQQFPIDDTPTLDDPFLPWIHDVFPTADGKFIQIVAQNKRRCKTGKNDGDILDFMQPQASLFQHVPVQRVKKDEKTTGTRYRLSTHEEADPDGMATRFICRFKPNMEETLSVFNFDYDWTSYRKRMKSGFTKDDGGIKSIHTTQLIFRCPVPEELQETIRKGTSVKNDFATLFLDIIPIRTPPRYGPPNQFLQPQYKEFELDSHARFDAVKEFGDNHVLPLIEDAGRWENIPICLPSLMAYEGQQEEDLPVQASAPQKKHRLATCIWASAGYATRGNRFAINDGQRRLLEWISYNKIIGFDHFYLYDNSGAFTNNTSLKPIADLFPGEVTYVPWPAQICNNNPNNVDSPGERSSQYAAESSCRLRFGPHVDWFGQFDIDEYFVPMGNHDTALQLLDELEKEDTRIVAFGSWRAWPRKKFINPIEPINDKDVCWSKETCFHLSIPENVTMLQAYNCDRQPPGQKTQTMPAEKQFFKADYVLQHFVHYSAATVLSEMNRSEYEKEGFQWKSRGFPDPRQRFGNELTEGLMVHTKAVAVQDTSGYERVCNVSNLALPEKRRGLCRLGIPFPKTPDGTNGTEDGWAYNCYVNERAENFFVPKLESALKKFGKLLD